jgi:hypothetical protein
VNDSENRYALTWVYDGTPAGVYFQTHDIIIQDNFGFMTCAVVQSILSCLQGISTLFQIADFDGHGRQLIISGAASRYDAINLRAELFDGCE